MCRHCLRVAPGPHPVVALRQPIDELRQGMDHMDLVQLVPLPEGLAGVPWLLSRSRTMPRLLHYDLALYRAPPGSPGLPPYRIGSGPLVPIFAGNAGRGSLANPFVLTFGLLPGGTTLLPFGTLLQLRRDPASMSPTTWPSGSANIAMRGPSRNGARRLTMSDVLKVQEETHPTPIVFVVDVQGQGEGVEQALITSSLATCACLDIPQAIFACSLVSRPWSRSETGWSASGVQGRGRMARSMASSTSLVTTKGGISRTRRPVEHRPPQARRRR